MGRLRRKGLRAGVCPARVMAASSRATGNFEGNIKGARFEVNALVTIVV
jgi:hypothetical protein